MSTIKLQSNDNQVFTVDVKVAQCSMTIKTMLEDLGMSEDEADQPVPLPNVNGNILKKVLDWCTFHKDDAPANEDECSDKRTDDICDWDAEFLKVSFFFFF